MTTDLRSSYRAIKDEIARRIAERVWPPGSLIPGEETLADEFGAARATVNRALQELAQAGMIERKRKSGTRVALHPVRHAKFSIPMVRNEISSLGRIYDYLLLERKKRSATICDAQRLGIRKGKPVLIVKCLHRGDGVPYQYEDRVINVEAVPDVLEQSFALAGPNEWLINSAPFSCAQLSWFAAAAETEEALHLSIPVGQPVFVAERSTLLLDQPITHVRMIHPQSHRLRTTI